MFNKQERRKSKYKYGGTKVCKAEEVIKYFVNPKIESFRLVCKLHYLQFGFQIYRSSRSQMFFGTGALKNFAMLEFLSNEVAGLQACNFIKKRLQHRCFSVKFAKSLRASFLQNTSGGCLWKYLMKSLLIAYENDGSCHCVVRIGSPALISFYCVCFVSFYFFLFFFNFFVDFTTCLGIEVSLSILQIKHWSCSQIPKWSFEG